MGDVLPDGCKSTLTVFSHHNDCVVFSLTQKRTHNMISLVISQYQYVVSNIAFFLIRRGQSSSVSWDRDVGDFDENAITLLSVYVVC